MTRVDVYQDGERQTINLCAGDVLIIEGIGGRYRFMFGRKAWQYRLNRVTRERDQARRLLADAEQLLAYHRIELEP